MLDLGIQKGSTSYEDDYDTKYLSQLEIGSEITGDIYIGELKSKDMWTYHICIL